MCPSGYISISENLDGSGKLFALPDKSRTIDGCAGICTDRQGCTGFEFATGSSETGACGTYTGGDDNKMNDENRLSSDCSWRSCIKSQNGNLCNICKLQNRLHNKTG